MRAPVDPERMSFSQQHQIWRSLDEEVRRTDPELWRTKQLSDFLAGIWSEGYGQIYCQGIDVLMLLRRAGQVIFVLAIAAIILKIQLRRNRKDGKTAAIR